MRFEKCCGVFKTLQLRQLSVNYRYGLENIWNGVFDFVFGGAW